ncbi:MAG: hypothetical protein IH820_15000 [Bacteroidetes bacterium]|nr:hypothetical protein [Bacteroidota bacterium]
MKYSNELKVGIALVLTTLIFYIGFRYLQDLPFFKGTTEFFTTFDDAGGLVARMRNCQCVMDPKLIHAFRRRSVDASVGA